MAITIIKLGGSVVSPSSDKLIDFDYLRDLKQAILPAVNSGAKFFITVGGGHLCRMYQEAARQAGITANIELHKIGVTSCVMNAELVRAYFSDIADEGVVKYQEFEEPFTITKSVKVGGAGKPGTSSDKQAIVAAETLGATKIFSLKDVDALYDKDPDNHPDAKRLAKVSWDEYLQIIGNPETHLPGGNYPVDPISARMAKEDGMEFVILSGRNFENLQKALEGKQFQGTIIKD